jgi:hypothetical protein
MSSFSAWGPTDDGRIKPDIVADGVNVVSSTNASLTTSYGSFSGTSMASPNAAGSLFLLTGILFQTEKRRIFTFGNFKGSCHSYC